MMPASSDRNAPAAIIKQTNSGLPNLPVFPPNGGFFCKLTNGTAVALYFTYTFAKEEWLDFCVKNR